MTMLGHSLVRGDGGASSRHRHPEPQINNSAKEAEAIWITWASCHDDMLSNVSWTACKQHSTRANRFGFWVTAVADTFDISLIFDTRKNKKGSHKNADRILTNPNHLRLLSLLLCSMLHEIIGYHCDCLRSRDETEQNCRWNDERCSQSVQLQ